MRHLAVIGAGSWGTALAIALAPRFDTVRLWTRKPEAAARMNDFRENRAYLPGFPFPATIAITCDLGSAIPDAAIVLIVVPAQHFRETMQAIYPHAAGGNSQIFASATKGLEQGSLERMSQVMVEVLGDPCVAVLSGPTFAKEVAAGEPAAVVIAAEQPGIADEVQQSFYTPALRFYTSSDVIGTEIGAALKNVIAIGAGICRGLGLGSSSVAALVTRGLAEITRLAVAMGGAPRTLSGLAGLGDLVLTTTGDLSRNRFVGMQLGLGRTLVSVLAEMNMVAEGVTTCRAAKELGMRYGVDLPIINAMHQILYEAKDVRQAVRELMDRPLTSE